MFKHSSNNFKAILLANAGFTAFSVSDALSKWLTLHYPPVQVIGFVAIFSVAAVLALSPLMGGLAGVARTQNLKAHLARGILNVLISLLIITSFSKMPIALVYTLVFVTPFLTSLLAIPVYGERVERSGWIAIAAGFAGVLVVLRPGLAAFNPYAALPLLASLMLAALFLLARRIGKDDPLASLPLFPVGANLLLITPLAAGLYGLPAPAHWPLFMLTGAIVMIGLACTAQAFRIARTSLVGPFLYVQMIWAVIFGYFLFGDVPDPWTFAGAALIMASGIYLIETERRAASPGRTRQI